MLARAVSIARTFEPGGEGLYFYGPPGTAKSHLLAAILNMCAARGQAARYGTVPAILRMIRQGFEDGTADDRLEALTQVPLLGLDDLGTEHASNWTETTLFDLLKVRDATGRPTIITSNLPLSELGDPRLSSLIQGNSLLIPLITSDYRSVLAAQRTHEPEQPKSPPYD